MPAPLPFSAARFRLVENDEYVKYADLTDDDWQLILPYLQENERLFNIPVERLLTVDGRKRTPQDVYRKIAPIELSVLK